MYNSLPMYQRIGKAAYKSDLKKTLSLDEYFQSPHKQYHTIHVGGTNGKGSVSAMIASVLMEAGYNVGLYTSPHLIDYRERIKVNGEMISKDYVTSFINEHFAVFDKIKPSFFEMSVALAFEYFRYKKIDFAVVEVGMGGRLDSTNIINPLLSVITNIGLDHTQFLGNTIERIAKEKAGIIKGNTDLVVGETNSLTSKLFLERAKELNSDVFFADNEVKIEKQQNEYYKITYKKNSFDFKPDLSGNYQRQNYSTSLLSLALLSEKFGELKDNSVIRRGFENITRNVGLKGRWHIISKHPLRICDVAHNKEGLTYVVDQLNEIHHGDKHFIIGFVNDKNIKDVLSVFPKSSNYYFTQSSVPRSLKSFELAKYAYSTGMKGDVYTSVEQAYQEALLKAKKEDLIFIGGSTFIVADLLYFLSNSALLKE